MEELSRFKYDGANDTWKYRINGRDATEEIEKIKAERAEQRRLYAEYGGTVSRILDNVIEFKNTTLETQKEFIEQLISNIMKKQPENIEVLTYVLKKIAKLENPKHDKEEINDLKYAIMEKIDECLQSKRDMEFLELDIDKGIQEFKRIEHKDNVIIDDNVITCKDEK